MSNPFAWSRGPQPEEPFKELLERIWNGRCINPCHINLFSEFGYLIKRRIDECLYVARGRKVGVPNPNKLTGFTRPWGRFRSDEWLR